MPSSPAAKSAFFNLVRRFPEVTISPFLYLPKVPLALNISIANNILVGSTS